MVEEDKGNLREKVFFVWGTLCAICFVYAYMLVPETKGLTLEQVDRMLEESTPRNSSKWKPNTRSMYSVRKDRTSLADTAEDEGEIGEKKQTSKRRPDR